MNDFMAGDYRQRVPGKRPVRSPACKRARSLGESREAIGWGINVIQTTYPLRVMRAVGLGP